MVIIDKKWNSLLQAHELTYLANTAADVVVADLDPDCAIGSIIIVVSEKTAYIKNTNGEWQKAGAEEVLK